MSEQELSGEVEPEQARELMAQGDARVIDIRPTEEAAEGHAPGVIVADPDDLETAIERAEHSGEGVKLLVMSADGDGADEVAEKLRSEGHEAAVIAGGWKAWEGDDQPIQPGQDEEYEGPELKQPGAPAPTEPDDGDETEDEEESEAG
jgi:rhodanese-related sulfurtransferase